MKIIRPANLLHFLMLLTMAAAPVAVNAQEKISLWVNGAPGFENRKDEPEQAQDYWVKNVQNPSITVFLPPKEKATGAGLVVCPGGGHRLLVYTAEGVEAAQFLNTLGITVFVLKYRLANEEGSHYTVEKEVNMDIHRAMRLVRSRAAEWGVDPRRIGVMGFSAGGEVAALVSYDSGAGDPKSKDPIEHVSSKPDFQVLVYPGPNYIPDVIPSDAPPAFLVAANDDPCCADPTISLLEKYHKAKVSVEAHIFAQGNHAFNMGNRSTLVTIKGWPQRLADWLKDNHYLD